MTPGPWRNAGQGAIVADDDPTRTALALPEASSLRARFLIADSVSPGNRAIVTLAPDLLAMTRVLLHAYEELAADAGHTSTGRRLVSEARALLARVPCEGAR